MTDIAPGAIYLAHDGSGKARPFVVLSRSELNRGNYCVAVPFTTQRLESRRSLPNCVFFARGSSGLTKACVAQADAITLLRLSDIVRPIRPIGRVGQGQLAELISAVGYVIGAVCRPE